MRLRGIKRGEALGIAVIIFITVFSALLNVFAVQYIGSYVLAVSDNDNGQAVRAETALSTQPNNGLVMVRAMVWVPDAQTVQFGVVTSSGDVYVEVSGGGTIAYLVVYGSSTSISLSQAPNGWVAIAIRLDFTNSVAYADIYAGDTAIGSGSASLTASTVTGVFVSGVSDAGTGVFYVDDVEVWWWPDDSGGPPATGSDLVLGDEETLEGSDGTTNLIYSDDFEDQATDFSVIDGTGAVTVVDADAEGVGDPNPPWGEAITTTTSTTTTSGGGAYYVLITISNSGSSDLTDYQVMIELTSTNFDGWASITQESIYFTDVSGNPLYYWIEEFDATNQHAVIWVKVPTIPADGSVTINMYYGGTNPYTTYNSPGDVFDFWDDFDELNDNIWDTSSTKVDDYRGYIIENGILIIYTGTREKLKPYNAINAIFSKNTFNVNDVVIEAKMRMEKINEYDRFNYYILGFGLSDTKQFPDGFVRMWGKNDRRHYAVVDADSLLFGSNRNEWDGSLTSFNIWSIVIADNIKYQYNYNTIFNELNSLTNNEYYITFAIGVGDGNSLDAWGEIHIDFVRLRKYGEVSVVIEQPSTTTTTTSTTVTTTTTTTSTTTTSTTTVYQTLTTTTAPLNPPQLTAQYRYEGWVWGGVEFINNEIVTDGFIATEPPQADVVQFSHVITDGLVQAGFEADPGGGLVGVAVGGYYSEGLAVVYNPSVDEIQLAKVSWSGTSWTFISTLASWRAQYAEPFEVYVKFGVTGSGGVVSICVWAGGVETWYRVGEDVLEGALTSIPYITYIGGVANAAGNIVIVRGDYVVVRQGSIGTQASTSSAPIIALPLGLLVAHAEGVDVGAFWVELGGTDALGSEVRLVVWDNGNGDADPTPGVVMLADLPVVWPLNGYVSVSYPVEVNPAFVSSITELSGEFENYFNSYGATTPLYQEPGEAPSLPPPLAGGEKYLAFVIIAVTAMLSTAVLAPAFVFVVVGEAALFTYWGWLNVPESAIALFFVLGLLGFARIRKGG